MRTLINKLPLNKLALFSIICVTAQPLYANNIKCWINQDGVYECGNHIPPDYSQKGFFEYDKSGHKIKEVPRAPTHEEIAEQKRQEQEKLLREEEAKRDISFLNLFANERDIELARKATLTSIAGQIQSINTIFNGLKHNLKDLENSYKRSKEIGVSKRQLNIIQKNINRIKKRLKDTEDNLQHMRQERDDTNQEYDAYVQQYREIKRRGGVPQQ